MGKSFVLRNEAERAVGYIQQVGNMLRCGIHATCGEAPFDLYLLDASGEVTVKRMDDTHNENEWRAESAVISGGCLVKDGRILADTGGQARIRVRQLLQKSTAASIFPKAPADQEKREPPRAKLPLHPERRWPPNPCNTGAVYRDGAWQMH